MTRSPSNDFIKIPFHKGGIFGSLEAITNGDVALIDVSILSNLGEVHLV